MARRPRGSLTTLGDMRRTQPPCGICGLPLTIGEPVAWTVGRDRIHESCIDLARLAVPGGAKFGPWRAPAVRMLLQRVGGQLCASCLAMALGLSLDEARDVIQVVDGVVGLQALPGACESCGRAGAALCALSRSAADRVAS